MRFCRDLADELGHATQCNAYVTPPGSQGFAPHHDTHDVFVLQVDGHKRWNIYEPLIRLPLKSQPSQNLTGEGPLVPEGTEPVLSTSFWVPATRSISRAVTSTPPRPTTTAPST